MIWWESEKLNGMKIILPCNLAILNIIVVTTLKYFIAVLILISQYLYAKLLAKITCIPIFIHSIH